MANFSSLDRSRLLDPNNIYFCYVNYIKGLLKIKSQQNPLFITILIIFIMPCHYPSDTYHSPPGWWKPKKLSGVNILSTWYEITFAVLRSNRQYKAYQYMQMLIIKELRYSWFPEKRLLSWMCAEGWLDSEDIKSVQYTEQIRFHEPHGTQTVPV